MACELVGRSAARADGVLIHEGQPLTAERVRAAIDHWLLDRGYLNPASIVAGGPLGRTATTWDTANCERGSR